MWLYVLRTCVCIAVFDFQAEHMMFSLKQSYILEEGQTMIHSNCHALPCNDLLGLYLVDLTFLCGHSSLYLEGNQLQQLPAGVFSSLTSLRSLTCVVVCIENVCEHVSV